VVLEAVQFSSHENETQDDYINKQIDDEYIAYIN